MDLFESAREFFRPTKKVEYMLIQGRPGWPDATMYRHHALQRNLPNSNYIFLSDADMLFESRVGKEILPLGGITATLHPGYVNAWPDDLPYERDHRSETYIPIGTGGSYYCGGFWGGTRQAVSCLTQATAQMIDRDRQLGHTPIWHDESALNKYLMANKPEIVLDPSYCYPANDTFYKTIWSLPYQRKLIALDKTSDQRDGR